MLKTKMKTGCPRKRTAAIPGQRRPELLPEGAARSESGKAAATEIFLGNQQHAFLSSRSPPMLFQLRSSGGSSVPRTTLTQFSWTLPPMVTTDQYTTQLKFKSFEDIPVQAAFYLFTYPDILLNMQKLKSLALFKLNITSTTRTSAAN